MSGSLGLHSHPAICCRTMGHQGFRYQTTPFIESAGEHTRAVDGLWMDDWNAYLDIKHLFVLLANSFLEVFDR